MFALNSLLHKIASDRRRSSPCPFALAYLCDLVARASWVLDPDVGGFIPDVAIAEFVTPGLCDPRVPSRGVLWFWRYC